MDTPTEQLVSAVAAAVAAIAAVVALVVAIIALVVAGKTLQEARSTTEAQRETLTATTALVAGTETLVTRVEASTGALHLILGEAQATRELEQLRRIADQVSVLIQWRRAVRKTTAEHNPAPWFEHNDAQTLLGVHLEGLPAGDLPKCRQMVTADPRYTDTLDDDATAEIKQAIGSARVRVSRLAALTTTELTNAAAEA
jgi:hypothetical protein